MKIKRAKKKTHKQTQKGKVHLTLEIVETKRVCTHLMFVLFFLCSITSIVCMFVVIFFLFGKIAIKFAFVDKILFGSFGLFGNEFTSSAMGYDPNE